MLLSTIAIQNHTDIQGHTPTSLGRERRCTARSLCCGVGSDVGRTRAMEMLFRFF